MSKRRARVQHRGWFDRCTVSVAASGSAADPRAVCGATLKRKRARNTRKGTYTLAQLEQMLVFANARAYDNDWMVRDQGRKDAEKLRKAIERAKKSPSGTARLGNPSLFSKLWGYGGPHPLPGPTYRGYKITKYGSDDYRVLALDRSSVFDSLRDAKSFIDAWVAVRNPRGIRRRLPVKGQRAVVVTVKNPGPMLGGY